MRRWLIVAVAFPVGAWILDQVADFLEDRHGEGPVTRLLRRPQEWRRTRTIH